MSNKTGLGIALLAGIAIGAGLGVMLAPDKGSKNREKLRGNVNEAKKNLKDKYGHVIQKAKASAEENYEHLVSDLSGKSQDVITFLEDKLAALKKEVAKY
jgi:gas vesicle protein